MVIKYPYLKKNSQIYTRNPKTEKLPSIRRDVTSTHKTELIQATLRLYCLSILAPRHGQRLTLNSKCQDCQVTQHKKFRYTNQINKIKFANKLASAYH